MILFRALYKCHHLIKVLPILLSLTVLSGCGYHLRATGDPMGIKIGSLSIPLMKSDSSSLGFEGLFTSAIREEFASHSKVPIVREEEATTVLIGRVYEIKTAPISYNIIQNRVQGNMTTYEETKTRRMKIKLDAKLVNRADGKIIWEARGMEEKSSFSVGNDPLANRYNQRLAVQKSASRFAERLYSKTMERF